MIDYTLLAITIALMLSPVVYAYGFYRGKMAERGKSLSVINGDIVSRKHNKQSECNKCGEIYNHSEWGYIQHESVRKIAQNGYCVSCAYAIDRQP